MSDAIETTKRGFPDLPCLACGEVDCVRVHLEDLLLSCGSCDAEYNAADIRVRIARWLPVLDWLDRAPIVK